MILTKEIEININGSNKKHLNELGYDTTKKSILIKYYGYFKNIASGGKYSCPKCYPIKIKENNIKKYGVESTNQLKSTQDKKKETLKNLYGIENISEISQDKVRKTKLERYGDEKYNNRIKAEETTIERYGVSNFRNTDDYAKKVKKTSLRKYGVEHFSQDPKIHRNQQMGGYMSKEYKNFQYRGSYELDFIKYCESNNIEIVNGPRIEYYSGTTKRYYYSDFEIVKYNLICEIKSKYYFNLDFEMNILKKEASLKQGYNFIFIIDKNYEELLEKIKGSN